MNKKSVIIAIIILINPIITHAIISPTSNNWTDDGVNYSSSAGAALSAFKARKPPSFYPYCVLGTVVKNFPPYGYDYGCGYDDNHLYWSGRIVFDESKGVTCPVNSTHTVPSLGCNCDSGYIQNAGQCQKDPAEACRQFSQLTVEGHACIDEPTACSNTEVGSENVDCQVTIVSHSEVGVQLKGMPCAEFKVQMHYTGGICTPGEPRAKSQPVTPVKPITNTTGEYCVDGKCIAKKACGEVDKQTCTETTTGGLLCYTQGKCSNTDAPPTPDAPYLTDTGGGTLTGKCKASGSKLDVLCNDMATKEGPQNGNGGGSGSYTEPGSISPPGLSATPGSGAVGDGTGTAGTGSEMSGFCKNNPNNLMCTTLEKPEDNSPLESETRTITFNKEMTASGQCPSPEQFTALGRTYSISYDYVCQVAIAIRPFVLIIASISATIWIFSVQAKVA